MLARPAGSPDLDRGAGSAPWKRDHGAALRGGPWSVRGYLLLILVTAAVLVVGAVGYGYAWSARQAEEQASAAMRAQSQVATREIAEAIGAAIPQVEQVAGQRGITAVFDQPSDCSMVIGGSEALPTDRLEIVRAAGQVGCS